MMIASNTSLARAAARQEFRAFFRGSRAPVLRTMRQFAEGEIVLPTGPHKDKKFRCSRQPWAGHYFDAIDSGLYTSHTLLAPTQTGKSLCGFVIPTCYHLFEIGETVVCGLPSMDIAGDKWREDFLPVIEKTRYRDLLPLGGRGSKGAEKPTAITFRNGVTLRFMSGGGDDKSRAAFTARVIVITEADGLDKSAATSEEASKIKQIIARSNAFGDLARIYKECTVSIDTGHIWSSYLAGTRSRLVLPCPHCRVFVLPEREHLCGYQDAADELQAREESCFHCPACGEAWAEEERVAANNQAQLIHHGQTINNEGVIEGEHPRTKSLGFRATAIHNLFTPTEKLAAGEWQAIRATDPDSAEKEQMQFVWVRPYTPPDVEISTISQTTVRDCVSDLTRALVPHDAKNVLLGSDMGKFVSHWFLLAFRPFCSPHLVDAGTIQMATNQIGIEKAIPQALDELKKMALAGWQRENAAEKVMPRMVGIDSRYMTDEVCEWIRNCGHRNMFYAMQGHGVSSHRSSTYHQPERIGGDVVHIGENYYIKYDRVRRVHVFHINADFWKEWLHQRIIVPAAQDGTTGPVLGPVPGRLTIFNARGHDRDLREIARHLTSEHREQRFVHGKGLEIKWVPTSGNNHWLDSAQIACMLAHYCGERLLKKVPAAAPPASQAQETNRMETPDGRPFLITER